MTIRTTVRPTLFGTTIDTADPGESRYYFLFNGIDQYGLFPAAERWAPATSAFTVRYKCAPSLDVATDAGVLESNTDWRYILQGGTQVVRVTYVQVGGGNEITNGLPQIVGDSRAFVHAQWNGPSAVGLALEVNGIESPLKSDEFDVAANGTLRSIGANQTGTTRFFPGAIWDVELIDPTDPLNTRFYPMNEGPGTTIFLAYDGNGKPVPAANIPISNFADNWRVAPIA